MILSLYVSKAFEQSNFGFAFKNTINLFKILKLVLLIRKCICLVNNDLSKYPYTNNS